MKTLRKLLLLPTYIYNEHYYHTRITEERGATLTNGVPAMSYLLIYREHGTLMLLYEVHQRPIFEAGYYLGPKQMERVLR